jgi:hypothetical protein
MNTTLMPCNEGLYYVSPSSFQSSQRGDLRLLHKSAITDDVGCKDGGKSALHR